MDFLDSESLHEVTRFGHELFVSRTVDDCRGRHQSAKYSVSESICHCSKVVGDSNSSDRSKIVGSNVGTLVLCRFGDSGYHHRSAL